MESKQNQSSGSNFGDTQNESNFNQQFDSRTGSRMMEGLSVRDFEEQLNSQKKENFNLKLKLHILETKLPNVPEEEQKLYYQYITAKSEKEEILKENNELKNLLQNAEISMDLLNEEHSKQVDKLNDVIKNLTDEIGMNDTTGNQKTKSQITINQDDTGFSNFYGALKKNNEDISEAMIIMKKKEIEMKKKLKETTDELTNLTTEKLKLSKEIEILNHKVLDLKELINKSKSVKNEAIDESLTELLEYKQKWADTQCELNDCQYQLKTITDEHDRALKYIKNKLNSNDTLNLRPSDMDNNQTFNDSFNTINYKDALAKATELCVLSISHIHELALFLKSFIDIPNIRMSLNTSIIKEVENMISRSLEMSKSLNVTNQSFIMDETQIQIMYQ